MKERENPFFIPYGTLHDTIPFDKIKLQDYEEAVLEGIRRDNEELEEIINNPNNPTFKNTILANHSKEKEFYYSLLDRSTETFFNLLSADTSKAMDDLAEKLIPIITQHENDVMFNKKLFERVKYVYLHPGQLSKEEQMLLKNYYDAFVQSGALLDDKGKERLRQITEEMSMLSLKFNQNLLKETNDFALHITDEAQLDGLPESAREAAAQEASDRGEEGWIFTLESPSYGPFMTFSTQRDLREKMYMAYHKRCLSGETSNVEICKKLVNLRREVAQMMGYGTYADYVMRNRMAGNVRRVHKLMTQLVRAYSTPAKKEVNEIVDLAQEMNSSEETRTKLKYKTKGMRMHLKKEAFTFQPWDFSYYSHKLQLQKHNIDSEMLRPYLKLENVIDGVFGLATRMYGITFAENPDIPVYHKDVKAYEVFDNDGSYLAVLYTDFYPRKGKQEGAWMTSFQGQYIDTDGTNVRPHVSLVMNFTKPTAKKPSLLTLGEVETFLHEFGHALHGIFANTKYEALSGTNVWWDFVELPSQFMENYAIESRFLKTFAFHYETGKVMPTKLIKRIVESRNFNVAYSCMRQVALSLLDMAYYMKKDEFDDDIIKFERHAYKKAQVMPDLDDTCISTQFSHIMTGGYAAGYYSYKWAEMLEADVFSVFKKRGIFNKSVAKKFRNKILSQGGTQHPMTLFKDFRGKEPSIDALLKRNGIPAPKR